MRSGQNLAGELAGVDAAGGSTDDGPDLVGLRCGKRRGGEPKDIVLRFERDVMRFTPVDLRPGSKPGYTPDLTGAAVAWEDDDELI